MTPSRNVLNRLFYVTGCNSFKADESYCRLVLGYDAVGGRFITSLVCTCCLREVPHSAYPEVVLEVVDCDGPVFRASESMSFDMMLLQFCDWADDNNLSRNARCLCEWCSHEVSAADAGYPDSHESCIMLNSDYGPDGR